MVMGAKPPEGVDGFLIVVLGGGGQIEIVESRGWGKEAMGGGTSFHHPLDLIPVFPLELLLVLDPLGWQCCQG
jgi:hypothetical protein